MWPLWQISPVRLIKVMMVVCVSSGLLSFGLFAMTSFEISIVATPTVRFAYFLQFIGVCVVLSFKTAVLNDVIDQLDFSREVGR
jgi:hypothetical protein